MRPRKNRYFVGDFETTVYSGQTDTEVWSSACAELFTDNVKVFHSISEQFEYFKSLNSNIICYYHNLKFDGSFWLSYLLTELNFEQALERTGETTNDVEWMKAKQMPNNSITYSISELGQWYRIVIKVSDKIIELRDSLKLLPFKLAEIGKSFNTEHKKLDMQYEGFRYAGCEITDDERKYIENDVLLLKEAMEIMYKEGHSKLTIGSCCLAEFRRLMGGSRYNKCFPQFI